jgi:SAM-dependent methyltransferase
MPAELQNRTQSHYDEYPFIEGGSNRVAWWREYLSDYLPDTDIRDRLMVDVGSSVGEISRGLIDRGARMTCVDLSLQSLTRCRQVNPEPDIFNASALELPFPDQTFDHAISIGVLHHTPDCRRGFKELARVTASGGTVVVFLYNFWNIYNPIFQLFKPFKRMVPLDRVPVWVVRLLQPFAKGHLGQPLDDQQLRRLLGDKLWTPQATFHSVSEVRRWGAEEGLTMTAHKKFYLGYANVMRFVKQGSRDPSVRREIRVKCRQCGQEPMVRSDQGYLCGRCQHRYALDGGIFRCIPSA